MGTAAGNEKYIKEEVEKNKIFWMLATIEFKNLLSPTYKI
jgi:hypothetical protein